jgi:regulator of sigma E protease
MSLIAELPLIGPTLAVAAPFLLVLSIVVFVHEYGHYIVGRWCGIGAETFSVGFGRELFGWTDRRGTRWRIALLPLGGYVKFKGDADAASGLRDQAALARLGPEARAQAFHLAPVGRRAATVAAGPFANFLLSVAIFAGVALVNGLPASAPVIGELGQDVDPAFAEAVREGDRVLAVEGEPVEDFAALHAALLAREGAPARLTLERGGQRLEVEAPWRAPARVDALAPGGAAETAGVEPGDVILAVDGEPVEGFAHLQRLTLASEGRPLRLTVEREGATVQVEVAPELRPAPDPATGEIVERPVLGVIKQPSELLPPWETVGPLQALRFGAERTWEIIALSVTGLWSVVSGQQEAAEVLGGPIRIAEVSGQAAEQGVGVFIGLVAVLSTSIGLINLFPIPVLDGGHLVFYAIEKVRGRPLRERWQEIGNGVGLALVISLMIFATFNDIMRL